MANKIEIKREEIKTAPATDFCRGKSSSLFKEVYESEIPLIVIKNSKPYTVIISYDQYLKVKENL